jgi:hypothetical protein
MGIFAVRSDIHNALDFSGLKNTLARMLGHQPDDREAGAEGQQKKRQNLECSQRLAPLVMGIIDAIITPNATSCRSPHRRFGNR